MNTASIADYMNKDFAIIKPDMLVVEASKKLIQKVMLGGPVVDDEGKLLGWVSEQECLQVTMQVLYHNQRVATVSDIMSKEVLSVSLDQDPHALAEQMLQAKPKSYPVVDERGKVIGVISRRHILSLLLHKLEDLSNPG